MSYYNNYTIKFQDHPRPSKSPYSWSLFKLGLKPLMTVSFQIVFLWFGFSPNILWADQQHHEVAPDFVHIRMVHTWNITTFVTITTQVMQSPPVMQNGFSWMLPLLKCLFFLGIIKIILWKLIEIFLMERRKLWKVSEHQRDLQNTLCTRSSPQQDWYMP